MQHLARHAAEVALTVSGAFNDKDGDIALSEDVVLALTGLHDAVEAIVKSFEKLSGLGRITKVLHRATLGNDVRMLREDLDASLQSFQVCLQDTAARRRDLNRRLAAVFSCPWQSKPPKNFTVLPPVLTTLPNEYSRHSNPRPVFSLQGLLLLVRVITRC